MEHERKFEESFFSLNMFVDHNALKHISRQNALSFLETLYLPKMKRKKKRIHIVHDKCVPRTSYITIQIRRTYQFSVFLVSFLIVMM